MKILFTETGFDDGDSITHYLISHFAFKHPDLFLHHWGKPFFTLVSAPFASLGFKGIQLFNILCGCASAFISFKVAEKLDIKHAYAAVIFTLLAPIYYAVLPTGLTEPFFSLILISSVYLLLLNKDGAAALLVSFLPFARSEGFLLLPLIALYFLLTRNFKVIPLLAFATLLYSITGYFVFNDFGWIFSQNPYKTTDFYGHGNLLDFVGNIKVLTGIPLTILFVTGVAVYIYSSYIRGKKNALAKPVLIEAVLYLCFILYLTAHSIFWWKGLFGSLGMMRVIAGVVPVFTIGAVRGYSFIIEQIKNRFPKIADTAALIMLLGIILMPIKFYGIRGKMDVRLKVVKNACEYIKQNNIDEKLVYYSHPFTVIGLDIDPFMKDDPRELMYLPDGPSSIKQGRYILWDSQYGPIESHTPLDQLTESGNFSLVKKFSPDKDIEVIAGRKFVVMLFRRN